jgi:hypothetical protein
MEGLLRDRSENEVPVANGRRLLSHIRSTQPIFVAIQENQSDWARPLLGRRAASRLHHDQSPGGEPEKALSVTDLTELTGMDRSALAKLGAGQRPNPTSEALVRSAEAVGKRLVVALTSA